MSNLLCLYLVWTVSSVCDSKHVLGNFSDCVSKSSLDLHFAVFGGLDCSFRGTVERTCVSICLTKVDTDRYGLSVEVKQFLRFYFRRRAFEEETKILIPEIYT